jgi:hypothetical protein
LTKEYAARLDGQPIDLADLRGCFSSGPVRVVEIEVSPSNRITVLLATEFDGLTAGEQVQAAVWQLIGHLNGMLFVRDPARAPVRMLEVYERTAGGGWGRGAAYASVHDRVTSRDRFVAGRPDGLPLLASTPREVAWPALAAREARAADVLNALRGEPSWADLWKAEEIIHGYQDRIPNWPAFEVGWFRATATLDRHPRSSFHVQGPKAGRKSSREWFDDNGNPPEMELADARRLVAKLAAAWLDLI